MFYFTKKNINSNKIYGVSKIANLKIKWHNKSDKSAHVKKKNFI